MTGRAQATSISGLPSATTAKGGRPGRERHCETALMTAAMPATRQAICRPWMKALVASPLGASVPAVPSPNPKGWVWAGATVALGVAQTQPGTSTASEWRNRAEGATLRTARRQSQNARTKRPLSAPGKLSSIAG
jgi:hypothetical protein